jgi:hypothetical protein
MQDSALPSSAAWKFASEGRAPALSSQDSCTDFPLYAEEVMEDVDLNTSSTSSYLSSFSESSTTSSPATLPCPTDNTKPEAEGGGGGGEEEEEEEKEEQEEEENKGLHSPADLDSSIIDFLRYHLFSLSDQALLRNLIATGAHPTFDDALHAAYDASTNDKKARKFGSDIPARLVGVVKSDQECKSGLFAMGLPARQTARRQASSRKIRPTKAGVDASPSKAAVLPAAGQEKNQKQNQTQQQATPSPKTLLQSLPVTRKRLEQLARITKNGSEILQRRRERKRRQQQQSTNHQRQKLLNHLSRQRPPLPSTRRENGTVQLSAYSEDAFPAGISQFLNQPNAVSGRLGAEYVSAIRWWDEVVDSKKWGRGKGKEKGKGKGETKKVEVEVDSGYGSGVGGGAGVGVGMEGKAKRWKGKEKVVELELDSGWDLQCLDLDGLDVEILRAAGGV